MSAGIPELDAAFNSRQIGTGSALLSASDITSMYVRTDLSDDTVTSLGTSSGNVLARQRYEFLASRLNSLYSASDTVQPPALTGRFMIKD